MRYVIALGKFLLVAVVAWAVLCVPPTLIFNLGGPVAFCLGLVAGGIGAAVASRWVLEDVL